jgi:oligopeptide/dipeptide ABC transporter ATP-binding protein
MSDARIAAARPVDETISPPGEPPRPRTLVATDRITKYFPVQGGRLLSRVDRFVRAVDGVSLRVRRGETMGLVGESGCGKSTLGRLMLRLIEPTFGRVVYDGRDLTPLSQRALRPLRRRMQIIFQDPYSSLNPRMTVREIVGEAIAIHRLARGRSEEEARIVQLLERVGLRADVLDRYPHEFSGGQRQRIGIARALAVEPEFIVCDEPTSSLDVSIQAQIVNLLMELQETFGLSYLLVSHDLNVVRHLSHRVAVMYLGKIVEQGPVDRLYEQPRHPYTRALLAAAPQADPERRRVRLVLEGEAPSPIDPPSGCAFHPRCPRAVPGRCNREAPVLTEIEEPGAALGAAAAPGHRVACWNPHPV